MSERSSFGPELRRAREHRGLRLEEIAEQTKVSVSLYRGLENNDLSRWPSGLFRRAFVRNYASAVGLDPEDVCRRFVRLFPEHDGDGPDMYAVPLAPPPATPGDLPRLTLADEPSGPGPAKPGYGRRIAAAVVDLSIAAIPAAIAGFLAGMTWFWTTAGVVGAAGHLVALAIRGRTPGALLLLPHAPVRGTETTAHQARHRVETEGPVLVASRTSVAVRPQRPGAVRAARRQGRR